MNSCLPFFSLNNTSNIPKLAVGKKFAENFFAFRSPVDKPAVSAGTYEFPSNVQRLSKALSVKLQAPKRY